MFLVGAQIGNVRKWVTFTPRFGAPDRTLREEDASAARDVAAQRAAERVGAMMRG
jgi:phenylalanyl-tRNA synthetase beta chain